MMIRSKQKLSIWPLVAVPVCLGVLASGCCLLGGGHHQKKNGSVADGRPHPMLAAARAHNVAMFGEAGSHVGGFAFTRAARALQRHTFTDVGSDTSPDVDPSGRRIVFASTRHNMQPDLYFKSIDGVAVTQLTSDPAADIQPTFNVDGSRVAFSSDRAGNWDIWVMGVNGDPPVQITHELSDDIHPSWSPDGQQIVYSSFSFVGGQWELWIADATAGGTRKFIGYGLFPEWSPAGDMIVYQRARERGSRRFSVWAIRLRDGEPRYPTELASSPRHAFILPTWSPDGAQIAVTGVAESHVDLSGAPMGTEVMDIWLLAADGRGRVRLTDGHSVNFAPVFGPDGRVYFSSHRAGHDNIWSVHPPEVMPMPADDMLFQAGGGGVTRISQASLRSIVDRTRAQKGL